MCGPHFFVRGEWGACFRGAGVGRRLSAGRGCVGAAFRRVRACEDVRRFRAAGFALPRHLVRCLCSRRGSSGTTAAAWSVRCFCTWARSGPPLSCRCPCVQREAACHSRSLALRCERDGLRVVVASRAAAVETNGKIAILWQKIRLFAVFGAAMRLLGFCGKSHLIYG